MTVLFEPTMGHWEFRNVTGAYDFWPRLGSITITQMNPEDIATMDFDVVDTGGSLDLQDEQRIRCRFDGTKIFAGHIKTVTETYVSEAGVRLFQCSAQDYTAKLDDSIIDHPKARQAEHGPARVAWILSFLHYPITTDNVTVPDEAMEKADYDGMSVREALDQVADDLRCFFYLDFGPDDSDVPDLHFFRNETITAPFDLDNDAPDFSDRFPFSEYARTRDSGDLLTRAYVKGEKGIAWVTDTDAVDAYGQQERTVEDPDLVTAGEILRAGARALAQDSAPTIEGTLVCWEPGLRSGMRVLLTVAEWDLAEVPVFLSSVSITAVDAHTGEEGDDDDDRVAHLKCQVTFTDRRRASFSGRPKTRLKDAEVEDGVDVAFDRKCLSALLGTDDGHGGTADSVSYGDVPPAHNTIVNACDYATTYIYADCPFGESGFNGRLIEEQYLEFDPGDLDDDGTVGVRVGYTADLLAGILLYTTYPLVYGVATGPPDGPGQYVILGECSMEGGEFTIPRSALVPNATNYIVLAAGWDAIAGAMVCSGQLQAGVKGPLGDSIDPGGGEFNSGRVRITFGSITTRVLVGAGQTPWMGVGGTVDGSNRTFALPGWSGKGVPQLRIGPVEYSPAIDYTYDAQAGTVTMGFAPWVGADLQGRWRT